MKRSPLKRLLAAFLGTVLTLLMFLGMALLVPGVRQSLLGERLRYRFPSEKGSLALELQMQVGSEVRGAGQTGPVESGEVQALKALVQEQLDSSGGEGCLRYQLGETRTERLQKSQSTSALAGTQVQVRVGAMGGVREATPAAHKEEVFLQSPVLLPTFHALWPTLNPGWSGTGATWSGSYRVEVGHKALKHPAVLVHQMTYRLEKFVQDGGVRLADVRWTGTVSGEGAVQAKGTLSGACFFGIDAQECLSGEFLVDQELTVPLQELPGDMSFSWRQALHGRYTRLKPGASPTPGETPQGQ